LVKSDVVKASFGDREKDLYKFGGVEKEKQSYNKEAARCG